MKTVDIKEVPLPSGKAAEIHVREDQDGGGYVSVLVFDHGTELELPMSLGSNAPENATEAMRGAEKFLATELAARTDRALLDRVRLHQAKAAAHDAYLAANRALAVLDETADPIWIRRAEAVRENSWQLYTALVLETEW